MGVEEEGVLALSAVRDSQPESWLAGPPELSRSARKASEMLFARSLQYALPKCPLRNLLAHDGFDAEQIWQQIDLQASPLLSCIRRRLRKFQHHQRIALLEHEEEAVAAPLSLRTTGAGDDDQLHCDEDTAPKEADERSMLFGSEAELSGDSLGEEELEEEEEDDDHFEEDHQERREGRHNVEDKFLKLRDMERFLNEAEGPQASPHLLLQQTDPPSEDEDADMQVEDQAEFNEALEGEDEAIRYDDFFGKSRKRTSSEESLENGSSKKQQNFDSKSMTSHEKQLTKIQRRIEQLEAENLDLKSWTMQGEVSALKRPKNSALEVELDFEHNIRPPPVITEEVTASLEDIIRSRIAENKFDDVEKRQSLLSSGPTEQTELDETKSKKGLAELYEDDYMQHLGATPASFTAANNWKKEAVSLFKALCVSLDALSHFHFTPKPVIEDMAVRPDVPALAMEEVAPLTVSDARMLAPEEVFRGNGVIKAEAELSREERKRRRARKKEQARAQKKRKVAGKSVDLNMNSFKNGAHKSAEAQHTVKHSQFSKSNKVFEHLDKSNMKEKRLLGHVRDANHISSYKL